MRYGIIKRLLLNSDSGEFDDRVLIESPFKATTRNGKNIGSAVHLALTPRKFIIASENALKTFGSFALSHLYDSELLNPLTLYPLKSLNLTIFKTSQRQSLKVCIDNKSTIYFELGQTHKRKIFWNLWCIHVIELNSAQKIWPFLYDASNASASSDAKQRDVNNKFKRMRTMASRSIYSPNKDEHLKWKDKYLYLGSKREDENRNLPIPIPGLGPTEDIKLLYLKAQYIASWDH